MLRGQSFFTGYSRPEHILRGLKYFTQKFKGSEIFLKNFKGSQILTRSIFKISRIHLKIYHRSHFRKNASYKKKKPIEQKISF